MQSLSWFESERMRERTQMQSLSWFETERERKEDELKCNHFRGLSRRRGIQYVCSRNSVGLKWRRGGGGGEECRGSYQRSESRYSRCQFVAWVIVDHQSTC